MPHPACRIDRVSVLGERIEATQPAPAARHAVCVRHTRHMHVALKLALEDPDECEQTANTRRIHVRLDRGFALCRYQHAQQPQQQGRGLAGPVRRVRRVIDGRVRLRSLQPALARLWIARLWRRLRLSGLLPMATRLRLRGARFRTLLRSRLRAAAAVAAGIAAALAALAVATAAAAAAAAAAARRATIELLPQSLACFIGNLLDEVVDGAAVHVIGHAESREQPEHAQIVWVGHLATRDDGGRADELGRLRQKGAVGQE